MKDPYPHCPLPTGEHLCNWFDQRLPLALGHGDTREKKKQKHPTRVKARGSKVDPMATGR